MRDSAAVTDANPDIKTLRRFLPYLWPADSRGLRRRVVVSLLLVLAGKSVGYVMPYSLKGAIDRMSHGPNAAVGLAVALVAAYAVARFSGVLFDNVRNAIFERVGQTAARHLSQDVFVHIHKLSLRYHLERRTGALTRVVERGTKSIDTMLYFILFNIFPTIVELIVTTTIFWLSFGAGLASATIVMATVYIVFTQRVTSWRNALRREMVDTDNRATARAVDALLNYETVKYFNAEDHEASGYGAAMSKWTEAAIKNQNSLSWLNIGQSLITNMLMGGALAYCVWGWSQGRFSVGDVFLIQTLLAQLFRPLDMLGMVYREIKQGLIDMEAMFRLLDTEAEIADAPGAQPLCITGGHVRFDHVDFAYESRRAILHDVSFDVPPGHKVAVVGHSGAGKSTLSRILYRFYDIGSGAVTIDGQDIRAVTQESLRRAIGIVPQDTVLFNDTIGYNIGYGRAGASQAEIEAAAKEAAIHDFIAALPDGYRSTVGERGLKLSGGEKQRVAIARTILKDPAILILDEATSALDSGTEAEIQDSLRAVSRSRTTLVIAHRLSTIVDADQILVMSEGRIVERGTHAALLAKDGVYAEMWALQQAEAEEAEQLQAAE
jgi:ABC-type transport system involved in Fe-S cluster assembly fused permease/ATPase subunit